MRVLLPLLVFGFVAASCASQDIDADYGFIYEEAPYPGCHASTIVELADGTLLGAWFGGKDEGDDSVEIWMSRYDGTSWSEAEAMTAFPEIPTWNPVLFRTGDRVWLHFKIGPSPREWLGAYRLSEDGGQTFGEVSYLPAGLVGPVRAKPITLADGTVLAGMSAEAGYDRQTPGDAPYRSWSSWALRSTDGGGSWSIHGPMILPDDPFGTIQPTLWEASDGRIISLMRTTSRQGYIAQSQSTDGGLTWGPSTDSGLPNPSAGIDAVKMSDGRVALVYNHLTSGRGSIHLAYSSDDGASWGDPITLEESDGEHSYPAIIQAADGTLHVTYTWHRERIRHIKIKPAP